MVDAIQGSKKFHPGYMYHKDAQDPIYVTSRDDEHALEDKGWTRSYIKKHYPKFVDGRIVKNEEEHKALLEYQGAMKVVKGDSKVTMTKEPAHAAATFKPPAAAKAPRGK